MHTEIIANDYVQEISAGTIPPGTHSSAITQLTAPLSAICVTTDTGGQVYETQEGGDPSTTVHLVHDGTHAIPQQVVETTTTELSAAAAILSVAGAQAFQQVTGLVISWMGGWVDCLLKYNARMCNRLKYNNVRLY